MIQNHLATGLANDIKRQICIAYLQLLYISNRKKVGLGLDNITNTCGWINNTSKDDIISTNIEDLKSKFGIDNVARDNYCFPNMYWLSKMHNTLVNTRYVVASPQSSIKP